MNFWQRFRRCAQVVLAVLAVVALVGALTSPAPQPGAPRSGTTGL
ncbi:hypothetical protein ACT80S_02665 [Ramlibacter sp. MAHUQ-53]